MYDAAVRATYADLFKLAEAGLEERVGAALQEALKDHPLLKLALDGKAHGA
jgi:hypothetical protein